MFADNFVYVTETLDRLLNNLLHDESISEENISILTVEAKNKMKYRKDLKGKFNILVESVRKYKGLENDIIIIPDLNHDFLQNPTIKKLLYVAMSRARVHVILLINTDSLSRKQKSSFKKEIEEFIIGN